MASRIIMDFTREHVTSFKNILHDVKWVVSAIFQVQS